MNVTSLAPNLSQEETAYADQRHASYQEGFSVQGLGRLDRIGHVGGEAPGFHINQSCFLVTKC